MSWPPGAIALDGQVVCTLILTDERRPHELAGPGKAGAPELVAPVSVAEEIDECRRELVVAHHQAVAPVAQDVRGSRVVRCHDRRAGGERLDVGNAESLVRAGKAERPGRLVQ